MMNKTAKIVMIAAGAVALGAGGYFLIRKKKKNDLIEKYDDEIEEKGTVTTDGFPLKIGSRGEDVKYLQKWINTFATFGQSRIEEDGVFGTETESRLYMLLGKKSIPKELFDKNIRG
jgi:LPXTG-motif cell wall-anchored protein